MKNCIPGKENICSHRVFGLLSRFTAPISYRLTQQVKGIPVLGFVRSKTPLQKCNPAYVGFDQYFFGFPATQLEGAFSDIYIHCLWVTINTLFELLRHLSVSLTTRRAVVLFTSLPSETAAAMSLRKMQLTLMAGLCYYNPYLMMRFKLASGKLWRVYNSILEPRQPSSSGPRVDAEWF